MVINHNAKGLYKAEVFFETTMPHPGGLSDDSSQNWLARMEQIKKKYGIKQKRICVTGLGATYHSRNIAKLLNADWLPMPSFKPHKYEMIYNIGFFGQVAQAFWNFSGLRVLHWIGSDILSIQQLGKPHKEKPEEARQNELKIKDSVISWIDNNIDINLCEMEATQKELEELGIKARIVPFPPIKMYKPTPLPEKFSVAIYMPYDNQQFYYPDIVEEVAKQLPDVDFHLFGDFTRLDKKKNIIHHGRVGGETKDKLIKDTSCILRLTPHDGLPLSVIEWITAGRNAITTVDMPYSQQIEPEKKQVIKALKSTMKKGVNEKGSKYYQKICDPNKFKKTLYSFMDVDIKKWWKKLSPIWHQMESGQETSEDISTIIKEIKKLKPKDIIDLGCGTGRWADLLPIDEYLGLDFSKKLIKEAQRKHPDKKFITADILEYKPEKKHDLAFTFATLLHIKPPDFEKYIEALKGIADRAVFVEPIRERLHEGKDRYLHPEIIKMQKADPNWYFNAKYTWIHDYLKHLNVEKVIPMSNNRNLFVVKL